MSKTEWLFWKANFYPANKSDLKSIQVALIVGEKSQLSKKVTLVLVT